MTYINPIAHFGVCFRHHCINPIAPFCETARASPKLSTRITARIQLSGMLNRCAASVTKTAKGREAGGQAGRPRSAGSRPRTAGRSSRKQKDQKIATTQIAI
jgi:hypothetical protein